MKRALPALALVLCSPVLAFAQTATSSGPAAPQAGFDPDAAPTTVHVVDDTEPMPPLVPRASDVLGSHVLLGAAIAPTWTLGSLGSSLTAASGLGTGLGFRADAGFGVSRTVALGLWGGFTGYGQGDDCGTCRGRAFSIGPFVRYQLSQGLRFDPWLALGSSYRQLSFIDAAGAKNKFQGVEWLRFEMGADYYVLSGFGFGPYGAVGLSSYTTRPAAAGDTTVSTELSVGLRLLLDVPGR